MTRKEYDKHHRKPRSLGGSNKARNISKVPSHLHKNWHALFKNWTPERIVQEINKYWLDPDYKIIAIKNES